MGGAKRPTAWRRLPPGSVIGIVVGGQLGRMMAMAASRLGYVTCVLSPDKEAPAVQVAQCHIHGDYDDPDSLARLAEAADVVTYELEQLPLEPMRWLAGRVPMAPDCIALEVSQDRVREKAFLNGVGVPTTEWATCRGPANVAAALREFQGGGILKVAYGGYDGKGQVAVPAEATTSDLEQTWQRLSGGRGMTAILEAPVAFDCELSVVVARDAAGRTSAFDPVRNVHRNHILDTTTVPAGVAPATAAEAQALALRVADALDYVGVMCLELFLTRDGRLLANEIAPRPHNSGHWTIDACYTDQFEQAIRAAAGLPLGDSSRFADARMKNLLGAEVERAAEHLAQGNARLHLYGKAEARPGRKMGHMTFLGRLGGDALPAPGQHRGDGAQSEEQQQRH